MLAKKGLGRPIQEFDLTMNVMKLTPGLLIKYTFNQDQIKIT